MSNTKILNKLKNQIIVSVQSSFGEPLYDENIMIAMVKSVISGGACALRLAGERDIKMFGILIKKFRLLELRNQKSFLKILRSWYI